MNIATLVTVAVAAVVLATYCGIAIARKSREAMVVGVIASCAILGVGGIYGYARSQAHAPAPASTVGTTR